MFVRCLPTPTLTPTLPPTIVVPQAEPSCLLKLTPIDIITQPKLSNAGWRFPSNCNSLLDILAEQTGNCYLALELGTDPDSSPIITEEVGLVLVSCGTESQEFCWISLEENNLISIDLEDGSTYLETNCL